MTNVVKFPGHEHLTLKDVPVAQVLDGMKDCEHVLVMGVQPDGEMVFASSTADAGMMMHMIETFKAQMYYVEPGDQFVGREE